MMQVYTHANNNLLSTLLRLKPKYLLPILNPIKIVHLKSPLSQNLQLGVHH